MQRIPDWIQPDWPAARNVRACATTRQGGVSMPPYQSFNLAAHVGDDAAAVMQNRQLLYDRLALPAEPVWLNQVHGCDVIELDQQVDVCQGDAAFTEAPGQVCVVLTADCLPLLMCDRQGKSVAAAHAGWRGLAAGVIERTVERFSQPPEALMAWMGPAIGPQAFAVGVNVFQVFAASDPGAESAFRQVAPERWLADLYVLARRRLIAAGVGFVGGGDYCTVTDSDLFFSYRREGTTGRMASLIWLESS